ncbi:hypothetical protein [Solirubrobacter soli]|uniref:hypothetical protein n=1 Tax=Solirubrobacter soli TaxID=363832 RepID=UPI0003FDA97D|nr:hypothetical protein [Solirubrobacter soli]
MAESSSPALPGDVEWLPGPGGTRLLRIHPSGSEPPALILRLSAGGERRIDAGASEYVIPRELDWSAAWLQWPDGTRAALPMPHGVHAEVIQLHPRRFARDTTEPLERGAAAESQLDPAGAADAAVPPLDQGVTPSAPAVPRLDDAPTAQPRDQGSAAPASDPGGSWTTPPQLADTTEAAEAAWRARRDDLRRELAEAADTIARAREGERTARDAVLTALAAVRADLRASRAAREAEASTLAAVSGELEAERAAHAVTRGSVGTLADALAAARAEIAAHKTRAEAARAELEAARATGAAELADARRDLTRTRAELTSLREALDARPPVTSGKSDLERRAREQAAAAAGAARRAPGDSAQLLANLDAAAAALRASAPRVGEPANDTDRAPADTAAPLENGSRAPGEPTTGDAARAPGPNAAPTSGDAVSAPGAATPGDAVPGIASPLRDASGAPDDPPTAAAAIAVPTGGAGRAPAPDVASSSARIVAASSTDLVVADGGRRLRQALVALARVDGVAAGALLVGLLPAQGAVLTGVLSYDITVRGVGTFAVFVEGGSARVVRLSRRRPRGEALFHLSAEPLVLAELLAGERDKIRRFRRNAKVSGRRRGFNELAPLKDARLSLADAARAGARLEPALVYRALPHAIDPEWTRGHTFTVAQRIAEFDPQTWHISVRDGQPLRVVERRTEARADAFVTMSRAAFERMLRNEPPADGDRPQIRGDRAAVAALKRWTDIARGA